MKDISTTIKKPNYCKIILFFVFISILSLSSSNATWGQTTKKQVKKEDYNLWGKLTVEELSEKGNWVSYTMKYQDKPDTLFVKHTQKNTLYYFVESSKGKFLGEKWFVCIERGNQLSVTNLDSGLKNIVKETNKFEIVNKGKHILFLTNASNENKKMILLNSESSLKKEWNDVTEFKYNEQTNTIAFIKSVQSKSEVSLLPLEKNTENTILIDSSSTKYEALTWQNNGNSIAYYKGKEKIAYYNCKENRRLELDSKEKSFFPENHGLYIKGNESITISDDGKRLFFEIEQKKIDKDTSGIQIWNTADRWVYPQFKEIQGWQKIPKIMVWIPEQKQLQQLTNKELPKGFLTANQKYAITYNPLSYEPQFAYSGPVDIYSTDIAKATTQLVLEKYHYQEEKIQMEPSGNYSVYFHKGHWFAYSFSNQKHKNLTESIRVNFADEKSDMPDTAPFFGFAGWTEKNDILVYDQYDVWKITPNTANAVRLTDGREQKTTYRLVKQYPENNSKSNFNRFEKGIYNLSSGLLFTTSGEKMKGYATWNPKVGLKTVVKEAKRLTQIRKAKNDNRYVYVEEHYNESPKLMFLDKNNNKKAILFQSNPQQNNFEWGFSKRISYQSPKGKQLKGALFYPAGYSKEKKYPMVVKIYESLSDTYDLYVNPSVYNSVGFNITNFTAQGFFVLLPDIEYEIGNPGLSATASVVAATQAALQEKAIEASKIGIIGHSFGGYETNFIISQTNLFAAAISGAGNSNLIDSYLYLDKNRGKPNQWRYEYYQGRMGKPLFEDWNGYIRNSPVFQMEKIQTPLMLWSGAEDFHVNYSQSIQFHLAHRRLQKTNVFILYEEEGHVINNKKNQIDLTQKTEEWFKHYLQDEPQLDWMKPQN